MRCVVYGPDSPVRANGNTFSVHRSEGVLSVTGKREQTVSVDVAQAGQPPAAAAVYRDHIAPAMSRACLGEDSTVIILADASSSLRQLHMGSSQTMISMALRHFKNVFSSTSDPHLRHSLSLSVQAVDADGRIADLLAHPKGTVTADPLTPTSLPLMSNDDALTACEVALPFSAAHHLVLHLTATSYRLGQRDVAGEWSEAKRGKLSWTPFRVGTLTLAALAPVDGDRSTAFLQPVYLALAPNPPEVDGGVVSLLEGALVRGDTPSMLVVDVSGLRETGRGREAPDRVEHSWRRMVEIARLSVALASLTPSPPEFFYRHASASDYRGVLRGEGDNVQAVVARMRSSRVGTQQTRQERPERGQREDSQRERERDAEMERSRRGLVERVEGTTHERDTQERLPQPSESPVYRRISAKMRSSQTSLGSPTVSARREGAEGRGVSDKPRRVGGRVVRQREKVPATRAQKSRRVKPTTSVDKTPLRPNPQPRSPYLHVLPEDEPVEEERERERLGNSRGLSDLERQTEERVRRERERQAAKAEPAPANPNVARALKNRIDTLLCACIVAEAAVTRLQKKKETANTQNTALKAKLSGMTHTEQRLMRQIKAARDQLKAKEEGETKRDVRLEAERERERAKAVAQLKRSKQRRAALTEQLRARERERETSVSRGTPTPSSSPPVPIPQTSMSGTSPQKDTPDPLTAVLIGSKDSLLSPSLSP
ncbi:hypothetical protein KIPB_002087, partial [Kipferlia bialata]|eukprot:g2087.t1